MATAITRDNAAPHRPRGTEPDSAAVGHLLVSTAFLVVGAALTLLSLVAMRFPALLAGAIGYGRLRPMAMIASLLGWLTLSLIGGVYYVLPRLTGTALWREDLARTGLWLAAAVNGAGIVTVGLGLGDGREPFGLPWWLDLPVGVTLIIPTLVVVNSIHRRRESSLYPTLWFALAAVIWLPVLYMVGNLPGLAAVASTLGDLLFIGGFLNMVVIGLGGGLAYYTVVKVSGLPLASRQLAGVGFWSLCFGAVWAGPAQMTFSPVPDWLSAVAAVLGLAVPLAVAATTTNLLLTVGTHLADARQQPALSSAVAGTITATLVSVVIALASFRSTAALVGLTVFWEGVILLVVFAVGGLLTASWSYQALPNLAGRMLFSMRLARRHIRLTLAGVGSAGVLLMGAGLLQGYGWAGGAFTGAYNGIEGWAESAGPPAILIGLAVAAFAIGVWGLLAFALNVGRTLTSGRVTTQEVLVVGDTES